MKKNNKIYFIILVIVFILVYFYINKNGREEANNNSEIVWLTYKNEDLGFEIKYPKEVLDWDSECKINDGEYYSGYGKVPLKFFVEDNNVYIDNEYFYKGLNNGCEKIYNSVDALKDQDLWKIVIKDNIFTDDDLLNFIKEFHGDKCELGDKIGSFQEGVYDVKAKNDGKSLDETNCPLNGWYVIKYYPIKGKVAAWHIGQEPNFWGDEYGDVTYDQQMVDSFRFLE
ncbi:hypothetical protein C4566_03370 [Candidatus Parcubacteria bacterium]|nr:MAG: hypothetical protein C4566_03370 [Candidatus Parcubacteria bacterium]